MDEQIKKAEEIERVLRFRNPTFWQKRQIDYVYKFRRPVKRFLKKYRTFDYQPPTPISDDQVRKNMFEDNKSLFMEFSQTMKEHAIISSIISALIVAGIIALVVLL